MRSDATWIAADFQALSGFPLRRPVKTKRIESQNRENQTNSCKLDGQRCMVSKRHESSLMVIG